MTIEALSLFESPDLSHSDNKRTERKTLWARSNNLARGSRQRAETERVKARLRSLTRAYTRVFHNDIGGERPLSRRTLKWKLRE